MATNSATNPTLLDVASRLEPNGGSISTIVEILNETNEILQDMTVMEANDGTSHKTTVRTGLPSATWRKLYGGVQPSKSTTAQVRDSIGMLEAYAEVDAALLAMSPNPGAFRLSEDRAFIESMNQEMADTLFYGNTDTEPEKFMGLGPRFGDLSGPANADNIIDAGGTGSDNTSVWLVIWGPNTVHGLYPRGSKAGLSHKDLGEDTKTNSDGSMYQVVRTHYKWDLGLSVRDWRYIIRICNIDKSDLTKDAATGADLVDLMVRALEIVPSLSAGRAAFYCNRTIRSFLRRQISNKDNVNLSLETVAGKRVLAFDGVSVRRCDAILNTEARVV